RLTPRSTLFPYTTLFRSTDAQADPQLAAGDLQFLGHACLDPVGQYGCGGRLNAACNHHDELIAAESGEKRTFRGDLEALRDLARSEEHTSELQSRENLVC